MTLDQSKSPHLSKSGLQGQPIQWHDTKAAVVSKEGSVTICGSTFVGNRNSGSGGAVAVHKGTVYVERSTFLENTAGGEGGAIYAVPNPTQLLAEKYGGAYAVRVTNSTFIGNRARAGGAIFSRSVDVMSCSFAQNTATSEQHNLTIGFGNNRYFRGMPTSLQGGAIYTTTLTRVLHSNFTENSAVQGGGAITSGGETFVHGSIFSGNMAVNSWGGATAATFQSVVLQIDDADFCPLELTNHNNQKICVGLVVRESTFQRNYAQMGGAVYSIYTSDITTSNFTHNRAQLGGGLYGTKSRISNCTLNNNGPWNSNERVSDGRNYANWIPGVRYGGLCI